MEKFFVADSYKNMKIVGEPFLNDKGKMVIKVQDTCDRCGGLGIVVSRVENGQPIPIPVDGGVCYKCNGTKVVTKIVRAYDEKEYNRLKAANERNRAKKEEKKQARIREYTENAEKYKQEAALKLDFGNDKKVYVVYGDNTYAIKDTLKEMGAKYNTVLNWHFSAPVDGLPEGYDLCAFDFDELYNYHINTGVATIKDDAKNIIAERIDGLIEPVVSEFYPAEEKERIRNLRVTVKNIYGFDGYYGYTHVYTFVLKDYVFVWMTSKGLNLNIGDEVDLTGTIKKFEEYNGINNTYLTRCVVKTIN